MDGKEVVDRLNSALEGRYHVERQLGQGGMATVYLARDVKHERSVALKVLRPELAAVVGAERFLSEIRTTANLQHPHILPLFDSGEAGSFLFYVMPYVEGESLRERLDRERQLPVADAVRIASAIAGALDHAHRQAVVHRDIKPGNVLLRDGQPMVSDFGIALAVGSAGGPRLTETGLSLGTPHYMSPEQATGDQPLGPGTDLYALGCILFEMLAGEPPFTGTTAQAVLGKVITGEPRRVTEERPAVPPNVDAVIVRALQKLPADRFRSAAEMARALEDPSFRFGSPASSPRSARTSRSVLLGVAVGITAGIGLGLAVGRGLLERRSYPVPTVWQEIAPLGWGDHVAVHRLVALSPDGSRLVTAVSHDRMETWRLGVKSTDAPEVRELPGTEFGAHPTFSPDGAWVAFLVEDATEVMGGRTILKKHNLLDGRTVDVANGVERFQENPSLAWLEHGTIVYEPGGEPARLLRIPDDGSGSPDTIFTARPADEIHSVAALPGGRGLLLGTHAGLSVLDLKGGQTKPLVEGALRGWYAPTGHVVYVGPGGIVYAVPFDVDALEVSGAGAPVFEGVAYSGNLVGMAIGADGTVVYVTGGGSDGVRRDELVWVSRDGTYEPVSAALPLEAYVAGAISPDGSRIALPIFDREMEAPLPAQIWVFTLPDGPLTRLTTAPTLNRRPDWSPDGTRIAYMEAGTARWVAADGGSEGVAQSVLPEGVRAQEVFYARDGSGVLFRYGDANTGSGDIGFYDFLSGDLRRPLFRSEFNERSVSLSPDSRWLSYQSNISGRGEVFVRPFPAAGAPVVQVSGAGGRDPVWGPGMEELFYIDQEGFLIAARFTTEDGFRVVARETLFQLTDHYRETNGGAWRRVAVAKDGRFLLIREIPLPEEQATPRFYRVQGFLSHLERVLSD